MSAAAADRRHVQLVELVMELETSITDEQRLDRGADLQMGRTRRFVAAVERWLQARVPATSHVFVLIGGIADGLRGFRAVDVLRDRENARQLALARELAGMLDIAAAVATELPRERDTIDAAVAVIA